ncbi:pyridoxamine 5'-phosphate oxidase family protein [Nocardia sp. NPDC006630]|uniref:pyridoxamine 5'-phosphate oxidase family protein n=1 Tax=Nocardia sp. NPDC006630 TaxID=3157181 RepID=UPI0033B04A75
MRRLEVPEIGELLGLDVVAHLSTIDSDGYPHVTPIWFLWEDGCIYLTSYPGRPHLGRIIRNPKVGLVIDVEAELRADGERPNKQVRLVGDAAVSIDPDETWTRHIRAKYIDSAVAPGMVDRALSRGRMVVAITPHTITAVASV